MDTRLPDRLAEGCAALALAVSEQQQCKLLEYIDLMLKWNRAYNLTAVRDPLQMVDRHLLDSLAVAAHLPGQRLIDVGTGGGLPGVPLAVMFPDREFHLLDGNGKKTRFLFQVKTALGLDNITVHHARVESFSPDKVYDVVLSRAFASLLDMVTGCRHLLAEGGCFLAMKGNYPERELDAVKSLCDFNAIQRLAVPGLEEQRHLVTMTLR